VAFRVSGKVKTSPLMTLITRIFTDSQNQNQSKTVDRSRPRLRKKICAGHAAPTVHKLKFVAQALLPVSPYINDELIGCRRPNPLSS
jgi:hypothetical protein